MFDTVLAACQPVLVPNGASVRFGFPATLASRSSVAPSSVGTAAVAFAAPGVRCAAAAARRPRLRSPARTKRISSFNEWSRYVSLGGALGLTPGGWDM